MRAEDTFRLFNESEKSLLDTFFESLNDPLQSTAGNTPDTATSQSYSYDAGLQKPPAKCSNPPIGLPVNDQQRRSSVREQLIALSDLLGAAHKFGVRALGLRAGAGTGVEEEDIDDRSDPEEDLSLCINEQEESRRRRNAQRRARNRARAMAKNVKGTGRGRGGSAGNAGSKSTVIFKAVDLLYWLEVQNDTLRKEITQLERIMNT
jgi:hypothetical protein